MDLQDSLEALKDWAGSITNTILSQLRLQD